MNNLRHLVILTTALLWSCTGTDVGNGIVDVDFAVYDSSESSALAAAAPPGLTITSAWVAVERVRLRDAASCEGETEAEFIGPFAVDMLAAGSIPELSGLEVLFTDYCRFELRW
ncbi:MAG: hypothetical protein HKN13_11440, partial [Rhodothermales bacterium]|nr:hypothetical protein [Rhodothermales bacterium]